MRTANKICKQIWVMERTDAHQRLWNAFYNITLHNFHWMSRSHLLSFTIFRAIWIWDMHSPRYDTKVSKHLFHLLWHPLLQLCWDVYVVSSFLHLYQDPYLWKGLIRPKNWSRKSSVVESLPRTQTNSLQKCHSNPSHTHTKLTVAVKKRRPAENDTILFMQHIQNQQHHEEPVNQYWN